MKELLPVKYQRTSEQFRVEIVPGINTFTFDLEK